MRCVLVGWIDKSSFTSTQEFLSMSIFTLKHFGKIGFLFSLALLWVTVYAATSKAMNPSTTVTSPHVTASLGAGCFWCIEAVYARIDGVIEVRSGYMGGSAEDANYTQVSTGRTAHAEVVEVVFDPEQLSYAELLEWFWQLHDPTTLNRQGADVGPQYRSVIFYHDETQKQVAETSKKQAQSAFADPIVTQIAPAGEFYVAENYHQDYYENNKNQGYCRYVIQPKLKKLKLD